MGPYTGLSQVLDAVVPVINASWPTLLLRHRIAILTVAPHLEPITGPSPLTLTAAAVGEERTRYHDGALSRRAAHGVVELLNEYARLRGLGPLRLHFEQVHAADATDQEFLAILLRRADPAVVQVCVGTGTGPLMAELGTALREYADRVEAPAAAPDQTAGAALLVEEFVVSDGTSDDPRSLVAWQSADPVRRAILHDLRADVLEATGDPRFTLGAIPFHREHGSDPTNRGVTALAAAVDYCVGQGFNTLAVQLARRGRALADPHRQQVEYCQFSGKIAACLAFSDPQESEEIYRELRARYALPRVHMSASYGSAMLHTRFLPAGQRDPVTARGLLNNAIAHATGTHNAADRAFFTTFNENGLALVEMFEGHLEEALRLVETGIERLDLELPGDRHLLHRSVLVYNRARALVALGRLADARAEFDRLIILDPHYAEYYLDRGNLLRRLGEDSAALADYERGMSLSAPIPELYYNRGDIRATTGDLPGALEDFGYVLDLQPDNLDALSNRAALFLQTGEFDAAIADATTGLERSPRDPELLCTRALAAMEAGQRDRAKRDFDAALDIDPTMIGALVNSAVLLSEDGDLTAAITRLTLAVDSIDDRPDPLLLYNRGFAYHMAGRLAEAVADYTAALALPGCDRIELLHQRGACLSRLALADPDPEPDHLEKRPAPGARRDTPQAPTPAPS